MSFWSYLNWCIEYFNWCIEYLNLNTVNFNFIIFKSKHYSDLIDDAASSFINSTFNLITGNASSAEFSEQDCDLINFWVNIVIVIVQTMYLISLGVTHILFCHFAAWCIKRFFALFNLS